MKRGLGFVCATFIVLGGSARAFADDASAGAGLESGGLKPPEAIDANTAPPSATEVQLDRAQKEDSGRGLEFVWLNADVGAEYLGLETLRSKQLVDSEIVDSKHAGFVTGVGAGVRLLVFTVGARFRFADFSEWQLWTLNAEAGLRIPLGRVEPYFTLGGGYASLGGFSGSDLAASLKSAGVNAHGLDLRGAFGVDVYLSNTFSVGGNLSGDVLFLSRAAKAAAPAQTVYARDGSGIGAGATLSAVLGLHF